MAQERGSMEERAVDTLGSELEALPFVRRALVEGPPWKVHLICEPAAEDSPLEASVFALLSGQGLTSEEVEVTTSYLSVPEPRRRVRLVEARMRHPKVGFTTARARLEWRDRQEQAEAEGIASPTGDLRLCALATLQAVARLVPKAPEFALVGIKQVHVFDHDLFVVLLRSAGRPDPALIGACLVKDNVAPSVAAAVLNALNRMLGNYLDVED